MASRFSTAGDVYCLDLEYWSLDYLRPIQQKDLAKTGDSDRVLIVAEVTLAALNPSASGKIHTVTTS